MNKNIVKILKRDNIGRAESSPIPVVSANSKTDIQLRVADTVGNWISERRANSQAEVAASVSRIAAWNATTETS